LFKYFLSESTPVEPALAGSLLSYSALYLQTLNIFDIFSKTNFFTGVSILHIFLVLLAFFRMFIYESALKSLCPRLSRIDFIEIKLVLFVQFVVFRANSFMISLSHPQTLGVNLNCIATSFSSWITFHSIFSGF